MFLAGWLASTPGGAPWVGQRLALSDQQVHQLLVCRTPRPDAYATDIAAIAKYLDVDATNLASALREAAVLAALSHRPRSSVDASEPVADGLLAAARDTAAEQLPVAHASSRLRDLAATTWHAAPADVRARRDVQAAIVWASPVMIVSLPQLHIATANQWLAERGVPSLDGDVGRLRGLLVAWRGQAAIFVDGTLAEPERRLTIAHEHGHLLLDYFAPRQRILRDAPQLFEIIDGHRQASDSDRARAALARVPLGVHTHLLHRDDHGGAVESTIQAEEDASVYALELLAPFDEVVALLRAGQIGAATYADQLRVAAEDVAEAFDLPADAARVRAAAALAAIGVRPGFFDR